MTKHYYIAEYMVTETCNNGKERRFKKTVLCEPYHNGRRIPEATMVELGYLELKKLHYYDIEYIGKKTKALVFI